MKNQNSSNGPKGNQAATKRNSENERSDTQKHKYTDYDDKLTNDENFKAGKPTEKMDFRDKDDNLTDEEEK